MLIDAISEHQNDWNTISTEVFAQTKTADECVLKFLELPITENMMARIKSKNKVEPETSNK
jgi:hypothetical protein